MFPVVLSSIVLATFVVQIWVLVYIVVWRLNLSLSRSLKLRVLKLSITVVCFMSRMEIDVLVDSNAN